ncbi:N-acetyltransferase [Acinetobacter sp. WCHAc010034]|uniref:N-acetyltransferase n=1 Tax=Acinetobacter sp. WCHAc010034 TaxID=1879049 RepID=UPI000839EF70|nr:N-acetyltransferase [Acinetobacter sp. WCHAc010034]AYA02577.1 N-acetyltransferase [Acinetobacter sp. WCHAc010034]
MRAIRKAAADDMQAMLQIWLDASIQAHDFIPAAFWQNQLISMRDTYLPLAENYVIEDNNAVMGFASLLWPDAFLAALFVAPEQQSYGYGSALLDFLKQQRRELHLSVYAENAPAVSFYQKHGFKVISQGIDENTGHAEYAMTWLQD